MNIYSKKRKSIQFLQVDYFCHGESSASFTECIIFPMLVKLRQLSLHYILSSPNLVHVLRLLFAYLAFVRSTRPLYYYYHKFLYFFVVLAYYDLYDSQCWELLGGSFLSTFECRLCEKHITLRPHTGHLGVLTRRNHYPTIWV